jgi:hypothetical protein
MDSPDLNDPRVMDSLVRSIVATVRKDRRNGHTWHVDRALDDAMKAHGLTRDQILRFIRYVANEQRGNP